jgi:hypothetical protein
MNVEDNLLPIWEVKLKKRIDIQPIGKKYVQQMQIMITGDIK